MNYNTHSFNVQLAKEIGLKEAIVLQHIYFWVQNNSLIEEMNKDGRVWTYFSRKSLCEVFPYLSEQNVRTTIDNLISKGILIKGDYSSTSFKKANWYSLTNEGLDIFEKSTNPLVKITNHWLNQPTKDSNNNIYQENKENNIKKEKKFEDAQLPIVEETTDKVSPNPPSPLSLPYHSQEFIKWWDILISTKKWKGKSTHALQLSLDKLASVNEHDAIIAIKDSIENGWQGIFPKGSKNTQVVTQKQSSTPIWEVLGISEEEYKNNITNYGNK